MRPCLRQFLDLQVTSWHPNDVTAIKHTDIFNVDTKLLLPGEDYPIYATPPETSFGCDGYIEVEHLFEAIIWHVFIG